MTAAPAISVIIPMFNAEKYLAECLDSILAQTLQNFEVIMVNDASTDGSRKIAESYLKKFGGRLKIFDNEKNSGPGATRNKGLKLSDGEYVFFMDADDLILPNGLERMYGIAKYFDVEFLNCTGFYNMNDDGKQQTLRQLKKPTATDESILEMNLEWRVRGLLKDNFYWAPWRKLLRRDFLLRHKIFFPKGLKICEDEIWTHGLLFCAKKIVHVPLAVYLYRKSNNSLLRIERTHLQKINLFVNSIVKGQRWLDSIMGRVPFFATKPEYRYAILEHSAQRYFNQIYKNSSEVSSPEVYIAIKDEFEHELGKHDVMVSVLFTLVNNQRKIIEESKARIAELEENLKQGATS